MCRKKTRARLALSAAAVAGAVISGAQTWTNNSSNVFTVTNNSSIGNGTNLLTIDGTGNTTINCFIGAGSGGLTKNGAGTLTLGQFNTFTGGVTINAGTLQVTNAS